MTGRNFCLFSCTIAISGPSSFSRYGISQPFWIQACNSCSYSPWSHLGVGYSESLYFRDNPSWSPDYFHDVVRIHSLLSHLAWKLVLSRVMAAQIGVPCWANLTWPVPDIVIPPSCVIVSSPNSRSYPSSTLSTTRVRTATGSPLPKPIRTTLSSQHIGGTPANS